MSIRTLLEINHDFTHNITNDPEGFVKELSHYLASGSTDHVDLERYGVTVLSMRHHSGQFHLDLEAADISKKGKLLKGRNLLTRI